MTQSVLLVMIKQRSSDTEKRGKLAERQKSTVFSFQRLCFSK